jgi:hypothetical protein
METRFNDQCNSSCHYCASVYVNWARSCWSFSGRSLAEETIERQFDAISYLTARCEFLTQLLSGTPEANITSAVRHNGSPTNFSASLDTSLLMTDWGRFDHDCGVSVQMHFAVNFCWSCYLSSFRFSAAYCVKPFSHILDVQTITYVVTWRLLYRRYLVSVRPCN